jgi:hypothetical protein
MPLLFTDCLSCSRIVICGNLNSLYNTRYATPDWNLGMWAQTVPKAGVSAPGHKEYLKLYTIKVPTIDTISVLPR